MRGSFNARKYTLDESYFKIIDTEAKAYFLGLLYADGCNVKNKGFTISLQEKDAQILDLLNYELKSNRPIKIKYLNKKNKNWQNSHTLYVGNQVMSYDLEKLGCVPAKSLILDFPTEKQVPKHLIHHFVRGYIDGDGSISDSTKGNRHRFSLSVVGTLAFCEKLAKILSDKTFTKFNISKRFKNKETTTRQLRPTGGCKVTLSILDWVYSDCNFYIKRKFDKYIKIKTLWENITNRPKFKLISPNNKVFLVPRGKLTSFAKEHGLNILSLQRLMGGRIKSLFGWKGSRIYLDT